jgi:hypothetical protein
MLSVQNVVLNRLIVPLTRSLLSLHLEQALDGFPRKTIWRHKDSYGSDRTISAWSMHFAFVVSCKNIAIVDVRLQQLS